jgi:3-dehydroquinate dehydratase II
MEFFESERSSCKYCLKRVLYEFQLFKKGYIYAMKLIIINGPNLNLLGTREKSIYGNISLDELMAGLKKKYSSVALEHYQSNVEGELINKLQEVGFTYDGIIINAGGYTHTSVAIADAVAAIKTPCVEVHISNIFAREDFRHVSYLGKNCAGSISGFGLMSYELAIDYFLKK